MRINYDLPDLKAFCCLVDSGSFNKAAQALCLSPSALSRRIMKLEEAVGGRLVERTTRAMTLTGLGRDLHARLAPLLENLDDCLESAAHTARGERGQVCIACITTYAHSLLPVAMAALRRQFPHVRLDLRDDTGARVRDAVLDRTVEFGVTVMWEDDDRLASTFLYDDPYVLACTASHPLASRGSLTWAELAGERVLALRRTSANRQQMDTVLQQQGIAPPWFDEVEHLSSMMGFLEHGACLAVLPRLALAANPGLTAIPLSQPDISRRICLIRRHDLSPGRGGHM